MGALRKDVEQVVIDELKGYKKLCNSIKLLEQQPLGMGYNVPRYAEDKLQQLHDRLKGKPTHLYLNRREQELEATAIAHLTTYPAGINAQIKAVRSIQPVDPADKRNVKHLTRAMERVREARRGTPEGYDAIEEREAKLSLLCAEQKRIDTTLKAVTDMAPEMGRLLELRYVSGYKPDKICVELNVSRMTLHRWTQKALEVYADMAGY